MSKLSILLQTICFLFIITTSYSQKAIIKEIREIHPIYKVKNVFPVVTIPSNISSTKKINKVLQEDALYIDSIGFKKSIFEVVWDKENENSPGWVYFDFKYAVLSNTDHYLDLVISFEGGKHAQQSNLYYLFDNNTGENVQFVNLLTSDGQKWLISEMVNTQKKRIQKLLPSLEVSLKLPLNPLYQYDSLRRKDINDEYHMYISCLEKELALYLSDRDSFTYITLYIKDEMLIAEGIGCANSRNEQRLDELGDLKFSIPIKEISKYLTPYGMKLFLSMPK